MTVWDNLTGTCVCQFCSKTEPYPGKVFNFMAVCRAEHMILIAQRPPCEFSLAQSYVWPNFPHIPGTSAGTVANITYARCSHPIPFWTCSEELCVSLQTQARGEKQWHQHNESPALTDTAGPTTISFSSALYSLLHHLPHSLSIQLCKLKATPFPFPLEFNGRLAHHGNDIIKRKKWTMWKRDRIKCSVKVMYAKQCPPFHSSARDNSASHPTLYPQLPTFCRSELWGGDVIGYNVFFTESNHSLTP